jgi:hypothetical protein
MVFTLFYTKSSRDVVGLPFVWLWSRFGFDAELRQMERRLGFIAV